MNRRLTVKIFVAKDSLLGSSVPIAGWGFDISCRIESILNLVRCVDNEAPEFQCFFAREDHFIDHEFEYHKGQWLVC